MTRRSTQIEIAFVSAVGAAALGGCNAGAAYHRDWEQCVNQANVVVEDRLCEQHPQSTSGGLGYYHWWYSPQPYGMGSYVTGGSATPLAGSSVVRGGFGSSAHAGGGE